MADSDKVWSVNRRGKKLKIVANNNKKKCPVCGEQAIVYNDGSWETHKSYDYHANGKRKGSAYSTCKGPK